MISQVWRRVGPYGLNTLLVFGTGILSVPALIAYTGASNWSGIVVAQSIAAVCAALVGFGWPTTGPSLVAALTPRDRAAEYLRSLVIRSALFIVTAPICALTAVLLTSLDPSVAILAATAYLVQALGGAWFFVGESKPFLVLFIDTLPRTGAIVIGIGALALGAPLLVYAAILLIGTTVAGILAAVAILGRQRPPRPRKHELRTALRNQRDGLVTTSFNTVYANSPMIIASIVVPSAIESFALGLKLYHYAAAAIQPLVQAAQGWVPAAGASQVAHRVRRVRSVTLVLAAVGGLSLAALLPAIALALSAGSVTVGYEMALPLGITFAANMTSQLIGLACLTALGRSGVLAVSAGIGAAAGILLLFLLALAAGEVGLAIALALAETLITVIQLTSLRRTLRFLDQR